MQIFTFASGSTGNCSLILDRQTAVLIDMGISTRRVCAALSALGMSPNELSGVLITHEHNDHINGLETFVKHFDVPIFAPRTVANHLRWRLPGVEDYLSELYLGNYNNVGALAVAPFRTPHDTPESVGYRISGSVLFGYCTDCGHISGEVWEGLSGVDCAVIEANHDTRMLLDGNYPAHLKRRILSDRGHLSNEACGELAVRLAESGTRSLVLAHLSRENNTPSCALETVARALADRQIDGVEVKIAPEREVFSLKLEGCRKC